MEPTTTIQKIVKPPEYPSQEEVEKLKLIVSQGDEALAHFKRAAADRIKAGLALGQFFVKWKPKIGRGFDPWVKANFPSVSKTYSYMLIRLAKYVERKGPNCLKDAKHMMGALRLAGIFPENGKRRKVPGGSNPVKLARAYSWRLARFDLDQMTPEKRAELKAALKPVVELYGRL